MVDVETGILILRPRPEVARYAADPGNAPQWYRNIHSTQQLSSGPVGTGTRVAFSARLLMGPRMRRESRKDLLRLKSLLEGSPAARG